MFEKITKEVGVIMSEREDDIFKFGIGKEDEDYGKTRPFNLDKSLSKLMFGSKLSNDNRNKFTKIFPPLLERSWEILKTSNNSKPNITRRKFIEYPILIDEDTLLLMNDVGKSVTRGGGYHSWIHGARFTLLNGMSDLEMFDIPTNIDNLSAYSRKIKAGKIGHEAMLELRTEVLK